MDELEAGPQLDARIAEQVFGWIAEQWTDPLDGRAYSHRLRNTWGGAQEWLYDNPAPYSTKIEVAWMVVEQMYENGRWVFSLSYEPARTWVEFRRAGNQAHTSIAASAPLAICRAALKAVGAQ